MIMMQYPLSSQILTLLLSISISQCYRIDPDTVLTTLIRKRDQAVLELVMSDEFSVDGRSFAKGDDDVFEAQQRPDDINQGIAFCKLCRSLCQEPKMFSDEFSIAKAFLRTRYNFSIDRNIP